ncbi:hypothetical protein [Bosea sp. PAMC 26642]|uniref:hypothetical protein n=1 Tax=Bosea sp. (strain PAMC 26642) TaxID=1792307 RepID=UPI001F201958|nr:hypothetical protein [Bosea sp. PAMC 26642]
MRPELVFHNGENVRARDVVASLTRCGRSDTFGQAPFAAADELKAERVILTYVMAPPPVIEIRPFLNLRLGFIFP